MLSDCSLKHRGILPGHVEGAGSDRTLDARFYLPYSYAVSFSSGFHDRHEKSRHLSHGRQHERPLWETRRISEEFYWERLRRSEYAVGRHAQYLAVDKSLVDYKEMRHVGRHRDHPNVLVAEHPVSIGHYRFLLAAEDKGVEPLLVSHKRISGNLVISDMRAQLYEAGRLFREFHKEIMPFDIHSEPLAGIHGEPVDDDLRESAVVSIGHPAGADRAIAETPAVETVDRPALGLVDDHGWGNHKYERKQIQHTHIEDFQNPDKPSVHPSASVGRTDPRIVLQLLCSGICGHFAFTLPSI